MLARHAALGPPIPRRDIGAVVSDPAPGEHILRPARGARRCNFVRIHRAFRCPPAMAAGATGGSWELAAMVQVLEEWERTRWEAAIRAVVAVRPAAAWSPPPAIEPVSDAEGDAPARVEAGRTVTGRTRGDARHHAGEQGQGHRTRDGRATAADRDGLPLPLAPVRPARLARRGVARVARGHHGPRVLPAWASRPPLGAGTGHPRRVTGAETRRRSRAGRTQAGGSAAGWGVGLGESGMPNGTEPGRGEVAGAVRAGARSPGGQPWRTCHRPAAGVRRRERWDVI